MDVRIWRRATMALAATAGLLAPLVLLAPSAQRRRPQQVDNLADAVIACQETGLVGWDLVDYATGLVHRKFSHYSFWHLWETSERAFINSRGCAEQYNMALGRVLHELGFKVQPVHSSRVAMGNDPWWHAGHSWLQVTHERRTLDVCASMPTNKAGEVGFVPYAEVRPMWPWTAMNIRLALIPVATYQVWRHVLTGRQVPTWFYRPFDQLS